jgi:hypothetical protein
MITLRVGVGKDVKEDYPRTYVSSGASPGMEQALTIIAVKKKCLDVDKQLSK